MSVKALTWAFEQPIAGNEKVVLLCLADHFSDEAAQCWPSINRIIQRSSVSKSTVLRCISSLEKAGYITIEKRHRENGSKTSNLYRLNFDHVPHNVSPSAKMKLATPSVSDDTTPSVTVDTTPSVNGDTSRTVIKNHHIEPSNISSDFEEFWAAYPKRPGNPKAAAEKKYVNLRKQKVSHETLVNAARKYAEMRKGEDPKFTAMAVTWLNQWRFDDDYTLDGGTDSAAQLASDAEVNTIAPLFPGQIGDREAVKKLMAAEFSKGTTLDALCEAARKYRLYCKGPPYEDRRIAPATLDKWLRFKWREMDAYEFCSVGPDRIKTVRLKKVPA